MARTGAAAIGQWIERIPRRMGYSAGQSEFRALMRNAEWDG